MSFPAALIPEKIWCYANAMVSGNTDFFHDILGNVTKEDAMLADLKLLGIKNLDLYDVISGRNTSSNAEVMHPADIAALASFIKKARLIDGFEEFSFVGNFWKVNSTRYDGTIHYRRAVDYNLTRVDPLEVLNYGNIENEFWNFQLSTINTSGAGTVTISNSSRTITGISTNFTATTSGCKVGNWVLINGELRQIANIISATSMEVDRPFTSSLSGLSWKFGWQGVLQSNGDGSEYRCDYLTWKERAKNVRVLFQANPTANLKWHCYLGHPQGGQQSQIRDIAQYFDTLLIHDYITASASNGGFPNYPYTRQRIVNGAAADKSGTISTVGAVVTGVGTLFLDELHPDCKIEVNGQTRIVTSISSNTQCIVNVAFTGSIVNQTYGLSSDVIPIMSVEGPVNGNSFSGLPMSGRNYLGVISFTPPTIEKAYKYYVQTGYGGATAGVNYPNQITPAFNSETNVLVQRRITIRGIHIFDQSILRELNPQPSPAIVLSCANVSGLNVSSVSTTSVTLNWSVASGSTGYNLRYRQVGSSTWITDTSAINSYSLSGLTANTQYEFQIQNNCGSGNISSFSSSFNFFTSPLTCNIASSLSSGSITINSASLSWTASTSSPSSYNIRYRKVGTTTWTNTTSGTNSKNITSLLSNTQYEFQVQSDCGSGNVSTFTSSSLFTTLQQLTASISLEAAITCNGSSNGSLKMNPLGGSGGNTYLWSNGATTQTITGLSSGVYQCTVTDSSAASVNVSYTLTEPAEIVFNIIKTNTSNGLNNGVINFINVIGGNGTFTYHVGATTQTSPIFNSLAPGSYTCYVTDQNSCVASNQIIVIAADILIVTISIVDNISQIGENDGRLTASASNGTAPYSFTWSNGETTQNTSQSLSEGLYTVEVIDSIGNTGSAQFFLSDPIGTATNGQVLLFRVLVSNATSINSYTDIISNETVNRYFNKEFRYSINGIQFTLFEPLTDLALQNIQIDQTDSIILEFRYTRVGSDQTGFLILSLFDLDITSVTVDNGFEYDQSNFKNFFDSFDSEVVGWALNVLSKIYDNQVAKFVERNVTNSIDDDEDFIKLWKSICQYFAYYVILSRKYSKFYENQQLLLEFLRQRGLYICDGESLEVLDYLKNFYYDQIRKRGTIQIIETLSYEEDQSGSSSQSSIPLNVKGELLRLICKSACDDFIFNLRRKEKIGLNLGNSSPIYRGTSNMEPCNKIWKKLLSSTDYLLYPLFDSGSISSQLDIDVNEYIIRILQDSQKASGIGLDNISSPTLEYINQYAINVDPNIDYEFTFKIKGVNTSGLQFLSVGINAFNCEGVKIDIEDPFDESAKFAFIENTELNQQDKYYFFRAILHSKNKFPDWDTTQPYNRSTTVKNSGIFYLSLKPVPMGADILDTNYWVPLDQAQLNKNFSTNWNKGNSLKMNESVTKIIPFIKIEDKTNLVDYVDLLDVRLQPVSTNYSLGFLDTNNWIDFWIKNNNKNYSYLDIKEILRRYLLPYDVEFEFNKLRKPEIFAFTCEPLLFNGVPVIAACGTTDNPVVLGNRKFALADDISSTTTGYFGYSIMLRRPPIGTYILTSFKLDGLDIITSSQTLVVLTLSDLIFGTGLNGFVCTMNVTDWLNSFVSSDRIYFYDDMAVIFTSAITFELIFEVNTINSISGDPLNWVYKYNNDGFTVISLNGTPINSLIGPYILTVL